MLSCIQMNMSFADFEQGHLCKVHSSVGYHLPEDEAALDERFNSLIPPCVTIEHVACKL